MSSIRNTSFALACLGMFAPLPAMADDLTSVERLLCSASTVMLCTEDGECFGVRPREINMPQFVVIDIRDRVVATTRASDERRSTAIDHVRREGGRIVLQGMEAGRAFSFVIDEATGLLTVAVARDGVAVSVFGACTDAEVEAAEGP